VSNRDLDGAVPDEARAALLIVDVINGLEFPGGDVLLEPALAMAEQIHRLKQACRAAGIPVIYANDNFGRWRSRFDEITRHYLEQSCRGAPIIQRLMPDGDDYDIVKPKHSAFYATPLDLLLKHLGAEHLIITGLTTDQCVTFTAHDAYMRDYRLYVPADCSASIQAENHQTTLETMSRVLKAETAPWRVLDLEALAGDADS
jgi:nicotinamidase-related amidase